MATDQWPIACLVSEALLVIPGSELSADDHAFLDRHVEQIPLVAADVRARSDAARLDQPQTSGTR